MKVNASDGTQEGNLKKNKLKSLKNKAERSTKPARDKAVKKFKLQKSTKNGTMSKGADSKSEAKNHSKVGPSQNIGLPKSILKRKASDVAQETKSGANTSEGRPSPSSTDSKSKRSLKKLKAAARKLEGTHDSKVELDISPSQAIGMPKSAGQGKQTSLSQLSKKQKKKAHKTKPPVESREATTEPILKKSKVNGFGTDHQSQSNDSQTMPEDKASRISKSGKLKTKSLKGTQSGLFSKKSTKTKTGTPKVLSSTGKGPYQPKGTNVGTLAKPDWAVFKKEKKELRLARKQKRSDYSVTVEAKKMWEVLRNHNDTPANSEKLKEGVIKMHSLLKSHLDKLVMCHDTSRVVQWLVKQATPEIRTAIIEELKPIIKKMIVDRYASKCIGSLLKYGTKESAKVIIECCMGNVVKLMSNVISHAFLEKAYAEYATDKQKAELHSEFYSDLYKSSKDSNVKCLADAYKDTPALKAAFLSSTKANIKRVLNKNNATNRSTLLYAVMNDFLQECTKEDRDEILTVVRGWIFDLPSTKEAGRVGMLCVWYATNKEKKAIVKGLKDHVVEFAKSKHLQWILFAVFSLVDDIVLLSKVLFPEIVANLKDLGNHAMGRKLIVHLVSYGNTKFFHPIEKATLEEGERVGTAKKDHAKKREEILQLVSKPFLEAVANDPAFWFGCTCTSFTAMAVLTGAQDGDDKREAFAAVAKLLTDPKATAREEVQVPPGPKGKRKKKAAASESDAPAETIDVPLIAHFAVHRLVQQLMKENRVFAELLAQELTDETMKYWIPHNRGCFNLLRVWEIGEGDVPSKVRDLLKKHKQLLQTNPSVGAEFLLKKLNSD